MKFLLLSFICCIIFGKSLSRNVGEDIDDFKILKGDDGVHEDEDVRAFVHPAPQSIPFESRSAFNALRSNPPFPILSNDEQDGELNNNEVDSNSDSAPIKRETDFDKNEDPVEENLVFPSRDKREALGDKSLIHTLSIQKNKMDEKIKDTPDNSKFHGAQFLDE
ncbi:uncharacterized protein [Chironomus tepperi]|uniref:uncharacterized protein n=1 Tax=Chironomus tepperi TaxID=113505 RepID=UPI00391F23AB